MLREAISLVSEEVIRDKGRSWQGHCSQSLQQQLEGWTWLRAGL